MAVKLRYELRWKVFGYRWFERSPLFCFLHPFRAATEMRRFMQQANTYQGHLSLAWAQLGRAKGREEMDIELGITPRRVCLVCANVPLPEPCPKCGN